MVFRQIHSFRSSIIFIRSVCITNTRLYIIMIVIIIILSIRIVSLLCLTHSVAMPVENEKENKFKTSQAVCNRTFWREEKLNNHFIWPLPSLTISFLFHYFTLFLSLSVSCIYLLLLLLCKHAFSSKAKRIEQWTHQHIEGNAHKHTHRH